MPEDSEKAVPDSVEELKARLAEAEETLRAIREGEVDAVVVSGAQGEQVYSLVGAESVYRLIVDTMKEAAFTVAFDGTILYANGRFGEFVKQPVEQVVGHDLRQFVAAGDRAAVEAILTQGREQPVRQRLVFAASDGTAVPAHISSSVLDVPDGPSLCVVATDLTELENSTELIARLRQQQSALRESESRERARAAEFEALMEAAPVGIFVSGDTECRSMSGNQAAYDLLRRPRGSNLSKSGPEDEKPVNFRAMKDGKEIPLPELPMQKSAATGDAVRDHEMDFVFEDGVTVNILGNAVPLLDDKGCPRGAVGIFLDITGRKRAEETLRERAALLDLAHDTVMVREMDGTIRFWNRGAVEMYGHSQQEAIGRVSHELLRTVFPQPLAEIEAILLREGRWDGELRHTRRDGAVIVVASRWALQRTNARSTRVMEINNDITERKRAEGELRASEQRFRVLAEAMPQIVWTAEATGVRDYYNPRALEYAGASLRNLTGWKWISIIHPEDREATLDAWRRAIATGQIYEIEHRLRRADGECRWHLTRAVPVRNDQGAVIQWIGTATDIHDRKMAEQELERRVAERTAELRESQALMKSIVDSTSDLIWSVDPQHFGLLTFNSGLRDNLLQRGIHLRTGMRPEDVFADKDLADRWRAIYQRALAAGPFTSDYESPTAGSMVVTVNLLKREGKVFGISVFAKDISQRVRAEKELHRLNRSLRALSASNQAMVRARDESELLHGTCRILVEEGGYRLAWVGFAEQDEAKTVRPVAHAGVEEGYLASSRITWADTERGRGPTGTAIRTGQPSVCQNMLEVPQLAPWREEAGRRGYAASCAVPIVVGGKSIGALTVYSTVPEAFDVAEAKLLAELVEDLSYGLQALRTRAERRRMEEQLQTSEAMLKEAQSLALVGSWEWDVTSHRLTWSDELFRLYGLKPGEVEPTMEMFATFVLPENLPAVEREAQRALKDYESVEFDFRIKRADGQVRVLQALCHPFMSPEGRVIAVQGTTQDVTERVEAEEALKAERQRFFAVLETLPPMICLLTADYHVAFANRAFRERYGEARGRRCYDYCFGNSTPCEFCQTYDVLKTGLAHHWEVSTPEGSVIDVYDFPFTDVDGSPMILEMELDITEAKRAKEALEKANAYNRSLLEASLDPLVTISPNGKITDVNSAAEKVTGCLRKELIGADFSNYFTAPEKARLGYQRVFKEGFVQDYELEVRHRDGSTTPVLYNASVYRDQGGEVVGVFAAARDITTRKRAEEEIRRLNEELEQRVRLRTAQLEASNKELESFSYSVSHDLRAPLRAMDGFSRILLEEYRPQLPEKAQRYLDFVRDGAAHMGNLIDAMLTLSRLGRQELKRRPVEVREIVKQSINDLRADLEGSAVELVVGTLPSCDADPLLLRQVYVNLLSNAFKFSREREKVRIEIGALKACEVARARAPELQLLDANSCVYFVRDNGVGFNMRYADKLFGVFQRLHRQEEFKGTGIGLATVQQIIHKHGGQVWAESEVGKGATFYFTIGATIETVDNSHSESPA